MVPRATHPRYALRTARLPAPNVSGTCRCSSGRMRSASGVSATDVSEARAGIESRSTAAAAQPKTKRQDGARRDDMRGVRASDRSTKTLWNHERDDMRRPDPTKDSRRRCAAVDPAKCLAIGCLAPRYRETRDARRRCHGVTRRSGDADKSTWTNRRRQNGNQKTRAVAVAVAVAVAEDA